MARHRHGTVRSGATPDVVSGAVADALAAIGDQMRFELTTRGHPCEYPASNLGQYALGVELHIVFEPDEEGWVRATIEELPGVITCAPTRDEARKLVRDALDEWLAALTSAERATIGSDASRETLTLSVT